MGKPTLRKNSLQLRQFDGLVIKTLGYYLPTPPLGQDMTQGQFLSGV